MTKYDIIIKNENKIIAKSEYKYPYMDHFWLYECITKKAKRMIKDIKFNKINTEYKDHFTANLKIEVIEK